MQTTKQKFLVKGKILYEINIVAKRKTKFYFQLENYKSQAPIKRKRIRKADYAK